MHDLLNAPRPTPSPHVDSQTEADHRIANSLMMIASFMRLQAKTLRGTPMLTGADAADLLDESVSRVEAVAHLHRVLSTESGAATDCSIYLRAVGEAAARVCSYSGEARLRFELTPGLVLHPSRLASLGLLLNEAVINAHKYAHPSGVDGEIAIVCRPGDGGWLMSVEDDGVGLPVGFNPDTGGGLGFRVMRALATKLEGRLRHVSGPLGHKVELLLVP